MDEKELAAFLQDNSERIKEAAVEACIEKVKDSLRWGLPASVQEVVNDFMKNEVAPAVAKALADEKSGMIKAATAGASQISDQIAKVMVESAAKNLQGYRAKEIVASIFK